MGGKEIKIDSTEAAKNIKRIIGFLKLFMCETLAKRLVSMVLITVGVPNAEVAELTGLCDKSVRVVRKKLGTDEIEGLFLIKGGGRKRKLVDIEQAIIDEVDNNTYHSHQQIADMVQEKFGLKVSPHTIGRLLKKTVSNA